MEKHTPETRDAYRHFRVLPTRWMDNDVYGHVNNVVYYSYFDTVVNGFLLEQGLLDIERSPVIGLVAETACHFFRPMAFPDTVHAGLRVAQVSRCSVRYHIGLFREDEERAAAQGHFVHVYVDRVTRRATAIPARTRAELERLTLTA